MRLHLWHLLESIAGEEAEGWKWTPVTGNGLIFTCQKGSSHGFATLVKTKPLGTWQMDQTIHLSNSHSHLVICATFGITNVYSVQLGKLRLIKCKKWGQGLCGSNFSLLLLVLLLQSWGQYKARIQILGHMYMAGRASTIVLSSATTYYLFSDTSTTNCDLPLIIPLFAAIFLTLLFCQLISLENKLL